MFLRNKAVKNINTFCTVLNENFPIDELKQFDALFAFSNDLNYPHILSTLNSTKTTSKGKIKIGLLVGPSNFLSMLPELQSHGIDMLIMADIDCRVHHHSSHMLSCLKKSKDPYEYIQNYLINNPIENFRLPGIAPSLLSPANFYCTQRLLLFIRDSEYVKKLKEYYFLSNLDRYLLCKKIANIIPIQKITLDLFDVANCLKLAKILQSFDAELIFCNITNIHQYDKLNTLSSTLVALTCTSTKPYIMHSIRKGYFELKFPADLNIGLDTYFADCLKQDYKACKHKFLAEIYPTLIQTLKNKNQNSIINNQEKNNEVQLYFNKIKCELLSINNLTKAESFLYLQKIFKNHIQEFPFHNFELRNRGQLHPLYRTSLSLFKINDFIKGNNGGFCFQSSYLLYNALQYAGFDVCCSIAKILNGLSPDSLEAKRIPATHLILIANFEGRKYLLDPAMGMNAHCTPFLITESESIYEQNNHYFRMEKNDEYLFYRQINGKWSTLFCSTFLPANIKTITAQLTKLAYFPDILGIRDTITLVGIATPTGGKSLLWNSKNKTFMFKIICSQNPDSEEIFNDFDRAYNLIYNDFKITHISKLQFRKYCTDNFWPRSKQSIDIDFPIDDYEVSKMKQCFTPF